MKKVVSLMVVFCMVVVLFAACATPDGTESTTPSEAVSASEDASAETSGDDASGVIPPKNGETYHIGYSVGEFTFALCAQTAVLFEEECQSRGLLYTVTDGEKDATKQIDDINALIEKGVDALLVLPTDGNAVAAGVESAYEAGIPVFVILRDMPTVQDKYVAFSGTDDVELGKIAGQWIVDAVGEEGNIVYITGTPGLSTAENRTAGFHEIVDQYPNVKILAEQAGNYSRATAMDVMAAILQANPEIDAVWCANDEMAGGAIQAIDAANRNGILVGGANLQADAYQRLLDGTQAADVTTPPQMVIAALDAALAYLNGEEVDKILLYPLDLVTKDNAEQFEDQIY